MWAQEKENKAQMPLKKLHSKHWCAESKAQRYLHWTNWCKGAGTDTPSEAVLGQRKAGGASRIPWQQPRSSCPRAGERAHSPVVAEGWPVLAAASTLCPLVCLSPRSCTWHRAARGTTVKITAPINCSIAEQPSCEDTHQLHWACLKSTMQMLLRTLCKHKNSRNKTRWTIERYKKVPFDSSALKMHTMVYNSYCSKNLVWNIKTISRGAETDF